MCQYFWVFLQHSDSFVAIRAEETAKCMRAMVVVQAQSLVSHPADLARSTHRGHGVHAF